MITPEASPNFAVASPEELGDLFTTARRVLENNGEEWISDGYTTDYSFELSGRRLRAAMPDVAERLDVGDKVSIRYTLGEADSSDPDTAPTCEFLIQKSKSSVYTSELLSLVATGQDVQMGRELGLRPEFYGKVQYPQAAYDAGHNLQEQLGLDQLTNQECADLRVVLSEVDQVVPPRLRAIGRAALAFLSGRRPPAKD